MDTDHDLAYYGRRERAERVAAASAVNDAARFAHLQMANRYAELLGGPPVDRDQTIEY